MIDLVEWLRGHKIQYYHDAAEEIERWKQTALDYITTCEELREEIERLRAEVNRLQYVLEEVCECPFDPMSYAPPV